MSKSLIKFSEKDNHHILECLGIKISFRKKYSKINENHDKQNILDTSKLNRKKAKKESCKNKKTKILISYHKRDRLYENDICIPIHLGRVLATETTKDGTISQEDYQWMIDNMIGDDTGDNISHLNRYFNEMTGIYWAWKNYDQLGNPDYIGFMHYRSHFVFSDYPTYDDNLMTSNGYTNEIISSLMKDNSFLCGQFGWFEKGSYEEYKDRSEKYDGPNIIWYEAMLKILKNKYPERYDTICEWNNQKIAGPYKNMFITTKEIFFEYCNWIFPILLDLHKEFENYTYKNAHEKRNIGWLGEMLTNVISGTYQKIIHVKN